MNKSLMNEIALLLIVLLSNFLISMRTYAVGESCSGAIYLNNDSILNYEPIHLVDSVSWYSILGNGYTCSIDYRPSSNNQNDINI